MKAYLICILAAESLLLTGALPAFAGLFDDPGLEKMDTNEEKEESKPAQEARLVDSKWVSDSGSDSLGKTIKSLEMLVEIYEDDEGTFNVPRFLISTYPGQASIHLAFQTEDPAALLLSVGNYANLEGSTQVSLTSAYWSLPHGRLLTSTQIAKKRRVSYALEMTHTDTNSGIEFEILVAPLLKPTLEDSKLVPDWDLTLKKNSLLHCQTQDQSWTFFR